MLINSLRGWLAGLRVSAHASCGPCPRRPGRLGRWVPAPPPPRERDRGWALRAPPSVGRLPSQRGQVFSPGYSGEQNAPVPRDPRVCGAGSRAPAIPAEACQGFEPPHPDRSSHRSRPPGNRTTPRGPPILGSGWGLSVSPSRTPMGRGLETPESWGWAGWLAGWLAGAAGWVPQNGLAGLPNAACSLRCSSTIIL